MRDAQLEQKTFPLEDTRKQSQSIVCSRIGVFWRQARLNEYYIRDAEYCYHSSVNHAD